MQQYLDIAKEHWAVGRTFDEGMHLLVRNALISPRFLYRSLGQGRLDEHDLASRLSYFLTGGPPDPELVKLATRKRLSLELEETANRLMPRHATDTFVRDFTGQWLDTALLAEIMPDPKFRFTPYYVDMARSEVEHFFAEMLRENRPISDFIDPDFTYTSPLFAHDVYRIQMDGNKPDTKLGRQLQRIELEKGGKVGGLLGLSAIMMATANGVDTQPVLRGVWMLENILGTPPPKPPNNVPALAPDTRGANSPRERLAAHQSETACAICHRKIDPLGFVLENFDPVGRWRTHWPASKERIDAMAVLPDGTKVDGVVDLKRWLVEHVDLFAMCLAEKIITYATGRVPNISERHEIEMIVASNKRNGSGFRDLVLALIQSESFRTR